MADAPLPDWPLYLSREEAASYVGVSPSLFDDEVKLGMWPQATRRGKGERRVTWFRPAIDRMAAEREAGGGRHGETFENMRARFTAARQGDAKAPRGRQ